MDKKEGNKGRRPHGRKGDPKKRDTAPVTLDSEARLQNEAPQPKPRGGRCGASNQKLPQKQSLLWISYFTLHCRPGTMVG